MAEFNVRSDAVDVEQIMSQIRARIREKRGVDYTEAELQQLATVKLEKFLDPRGVRSDLAEQFRRQRVPPIATPPPKLPKYPFEDFTLYETHRGVLQGIRKLLQPILKLFFNPNPLIMALHVQAKASDVQTEINREFYRRLGVQEEMPAIYYDVVHNLVVELTRLGVEVHNLKMRVESLSSRLEFDERRARSLEGVVQYRKPAASAPAAPAGASAAAVAARAAAATGAAPVTGAGTEPHGAGSGSPPVGGDGERRRRRRRRRRRPGQTGADRAMTGAAAGRTDADDETAAPQGDDDGADVEAEDTPDTSDGPTGSDR
jgi:hypothetical protein